MIERRPFGRTRHQSTVTLFGGAALARATQDEADRTLEVLLSYGVNHIDTASRYGDSELRIGPWMARHRKDFFLATKTGMRGAREAREDLHRSLERLRVDSVDLIQLHSLGHPDDWDQAMGPGGALEALAAAKQQGLVRAIGVTGHGWTIAAMHRRSLAHFEFDSILLPYNFFMAQNDRYREAFHEVTAICRERNVAVQTIKAIARGPWAATDRSHATWYQPPEHPVDGPGSSSTPRGTSRSCRASSTRRAGSPTARPTRRWRRCTTPPGCPRSSACRPDPCPVATHPRVSIAT